MSHATQDLVAVTNSLADWSSVRAAVAWAGSETVGYAMAYREPDAWRDTQRLLDLRGMVDIALAEGRTTISLPKDAWLRLLLSFNNGVEMFDLRDGYRRAHEVRVAFMADLPAALRDGTFVCNKCDRVLAPSLLAERSGPQCADCWTPTRNGVSGPPGASRPA